MAESNSLRWGREGFCFSGRVRSLLAAGTGLNKKNSDGATALMVAASKGHVEIVKALLVAKADVNAKESDGYTALMMASQRGHTGIAKLLLAAKTDVNATEINGR